MRCKNYSLFVSTLSIAFVSHGQVLINEFCASNAFTVSDPETGDYSDWIELYNSGQNDVNLEGYHLTDNFNDPAKWSFPSGIVIRAGGVLLVWADDLNTGLHTSFKLSADGEEIGLFSPGLSLIDSIRFGIQKTDVSYGRTPDGGSAWGYFRQPTPGNANTTAVYSGILYSIPEFLTRGGMYATPVTVELFNDMGGEIRYTTDGSEPELTSPLYAFPIQVDETTILRARIFKPGMIPGPTVTNSYFINQNSAGGKLPVVSIATAAENFWDPVKGIYVQDFKPEWEVPVNIELYENNGSDRAAFSQLAGTRINGLYSWQLPQKMLGIYFRNAYDAGSLDYPLISQRNRSSYKSFALRASGSDWSYTLFRDMLGQHATLLNMNIDIMGFRPAILYVNGQYMGINNIREKVDNDYIEKSFNLEPGSFDLVENEDFAEAGSLDEYNYLLTLLSGDLSVESNYKEVASLVDIENVTDYMITEMAVENTSIQHNVMAWKPKGYGKWRWVLMDLDRGFFSPSSNLIDFYLRQDPMLLSELMENPGYRQYFGKRLAAQLFTSFNPLRMKELIDEHAGTIREEVPIHIQRWKGTTSSYGNAIPSFRYWEKEVENLRYFVERRPKALVDDLKKYGFESPAYLTVSALPHQGGKLLIDGLIVPGSYGNGPLPLNTTFNLRAESKPGYDFEGWMATHPSTLVAAGSDWKFYDKGQLPSPNWKEPGYNDNIWSSGPAQLGYGEGDENTIVSFGGNSQDKYITTYFRKKFTCKEDLSGASAIEIRLLRDDGAVVYINGTEVFRSNMPYGEIDNASMALNGVSVNDENKFLNFLIEPDNFISGENLIAVEVHQEYGTSSDLSFDLGLVAWYPDQTRLLSTAEEFPVTLQSDTFLTAKFIRNTSCLLPELVDQDLILGSECSPYYAGGDVRILSGASLTIQPGVEIRMPGNASIYVDGVLNINGREGEEVKMILNPSDAARSWGGIIFQNTHAASVLQYLVIEGASGGPDPKTQYAAISSFNADLVMDHLVIEDVESNPVIARYSDIKLTNSSLHSKVTGDLINVKYGKAYIENCTFRGNDRVDTDAIDYDEIDGGVIRNSTIRDFTGVNSDAVDIGEAAKNVLIDSIFVYHITDKGVSVGQRSSVTIKNSIFVNCDMGVALKDSCHAQVNRSVFYGNAHAVAAYEKNPGHAGGNGKIMNSILSNSTVSPASVDDKSSLVVSYSLSDTDPLQENHGNSAGNPLFTRPTFFNFTPMAGSPVFDGGMENENPVDLGVSLFSDVFDAPLVIQEFFINASNLNLPEFIGIFNPSKTTIDLSDFFFSEGILGAFPQGSTIHPGEKIYLTDNIASPEWSMYHGQVFQWESGKLANEGEAIQLREPNGIVTDFLRYENNGFWPEEGFVGEGVMVLKDPGLDNHFPENWTVLPFIRAVGLHSIQIQSDMRIWPNPTPGMITIQAPAYGRQFAEIYSILGKKIMEVQLDEQGEARLDLSSAKLTVVIVRVGNLNSKVIISGSLP